MFLLCLLSTHSLSPCLSHKHMHSQWQESQYFPFPSSYIFLFNCVFHCFFLSVIPIPRLICPPFLPLNPFAHHTRLFHRVSLDVYIIEALCANAYTESESKSLVSALPLASTPRSPNTLSLSPVYGVVSSCLLTCIL